MEMMPKDIKLEFLRRPRKFEEIMEKLEISVNEMLADNGPVPLDLERRYARCVKAGKGASKKGPYGAGTWYRGTELMNGRHDGGKIVGKKGSKGSKANLIGTVTMRKDPTETQVNCTR